MIEFETEFTKFGLLADNKWLFVILTDDKPEVFLQKNLIIVTGAELVKVHGIRHYKMIREIKEIEPTQTAIDNSVIERKGAFKGVKKEKLNKPVPIEFTPNIVIEKKQIIKSTIFRNAEGEMFNFPDGLRSDEIATIAKLMHAHFVVGEFELTTKLLPKASPYRSQAKI